MDTSKDEFYMKKIFILLSLISGSAFAETAFEKMAAAFNQYSEAPSIEFQVQSQENTDAFRKRVLSTLKDNGQSVGRLGANELFILGTTPWRKSCLLKLSNAKRNIGSDPQDDPNEYRLTVASDGVDAPFLGVRQGDDGARIYVPGVHVDTASVLFENENFVAETQHSQFAVSIDQSGKIANLKTKTHVKSCLAESIVFFLLLQDYCLKEIERDVISSCSPNL